MEYLRNKQNQVGNIDIAEREVQMSDGAQTANYLAVQFEKEAHLTEKLHLFWVNQKLEKMKSGTVISAGPCPLLVQAPQCVVSGCLLQPCCR